MQIKNIIVIVGVVILGIIIFNWTNELSQIKVGTQSSYIENFWRNGVAPSVAEEIKSQINTKYGLMSGFTLLVAGAALFLSNKGKDAQSQNSTDSQTTYTQDKTKEEKWRKEIEELKSKLEQLEKEAT